MEPLELLNKAQESDEFRRSISTAALLWAASSVVVLLMGRFGWVASYQDALPFIILITWLGSEIAARFPSRIPVAACKQCGRVQNLPRTLLRRFWPWRHCVVCGAPLQYSCSKKHLFSIFTDEGISSSEVNVPTGSKAEARASGSRRIAVNGICCSRCGEPSNEISPEKFIEYLSILASRKPKEVKDEALAPVIWRMIRGTNLGYDLRDSMRTIADNYKRIRGRRVVLLDIPSAANPEAANPDDLFD